MIQKPQKAENEFIQDSISNGAFKHILTVGGGRVVKFTFFIMRKIRTNIYKIGKYTIGCFFGITPLVRVISRIQQNNIKISFFFQKKKN